MNLKFWRKPNVRMEFSVGGDLVAGQSYRLSTTLADMMILKGYAHGSLSRSYSDSEKYEIIGTNNQRVVM